MSQPEMPLHDQEPVDADDEDEVAVEDQEPREDPPSWRGDLLVRFYQEGPWWAASFLFHMVLVLCLALGSLIYSKTVDATPLEEAPSFESAEAIGNANAGLDVEPPKIEQVDIGQAALEPSELTTESLKLDLTTPQFDQTNDAEKPVPPEDAGAGMASAASGPVLGGLGGFNVDVVGPGAAVQGLGGVGTSSGEGDIPGLGSGNVPGFSGRGDKARKDMVGGFGGTKASERAVSAALNWLARHQCRSGPQKGSWSLDKYKEQCKDPTCAGPGTVTADVGATALGVLPFLAAGQTHDTKGSPYRATVQAALYWLLSHQTRDGDLSPQSSPKMYCHGLATIALCEACGMVPRDAELRRRAQLAIDFIQKAQHPKTGGWRYTPGEEGDTSVLGWQVMALKSGQMAGLKVDPAVLAGAEKFLKTCSQGQLGGKYSYTPGGPETATMTAVALLCNQYLGARPDDPRLAEGVGYLNRTPPDTGPRNFYCWYYATQVMHNVPGPEWNTWNRKMRRVLIDTQCRQGCAAGSWDPDKPTEDAWGRQGGRLFVTSLGALTLEVYYRYLPLYRIEPGARPPADLQVGGDEKDGDGKASEKEKDPKKSEKAAKSEGSAGSPDADAARGAKPPEGDRKGDGKKDEKSGGKSDAAREAKAKS